MFLSNITLNSKRSQLQSWETAPLKPTDKLIIKPIMTWIRYDGRRENFILCRTLAPQKWSFEPEDKVLNLFLSLDLTFCDIKVEEVTIQDGLDHPSHNSNHVKEALKVEPPDPVEEIEGTVDTQAEQIVGGDGLSLSGLTDQEELRQDGH